MFTRLAPRLQCLSLIFDGLTNDHVFDRATANASRKGSLARLLNITALKHLSWLELANVALPLNLLRAFLKRHAAILNAFRLWRVGAVYPAPDQTSWNEVLSPLRSAALTYIKLSCLYEHVDTVVVFQPEGFESCTLCYLPLLDEWTCDILRDGMQTCILRIFGWIPAIYDVRPRNPL